MKLSRLFTLAMAACLSIAAYAQDTSNWRSGDDVTKLIGWKAYDGGEEWDWMEFPEDGYTVAWTPGMADNYGICRYNIVVREIRIDDMTTVAEARCEAVLAKPVPVVAIDVNYLEDNSKCTIFAWPTQEDNNLLISIDGGEEYMELPATGYEVAWTPGMADGKGNCVFDIVVVEIDEAGEIVCEGREQVILSEPACDFAEGDYYIKNVESGEFLTGGNSWGTRLVVSKSGQLMSLERMDNGVYAINSHFNSGDWSYVGSGDSPYVDQYRYDSNHKLIDLGDGTFAIKSDGRYLTASDDKIVYYLYTELTDASKWQFVTRNEMIESMAAATADKPVDVTPLIYDANFSNNNQYWNEWQWEGYQPVRGGNNANTNVEVWGGNGQEYDMYQVITGLPNGMYKISLDGFYRYNTTRDNSNSYAEQAHADGTEVIYAFLYGNDYETELKSIADEESVDIYGGMPFGQSEAGNAFENGAYKNELTVFVTDGTLRLGVRKSVDTGSYDWACWDNFQLEYYGELSLTDEDYMATAPVMKTKLQGLAYRVSLSYPLPGVQLYYSVDGGEAVEYTAPFLADETCSIVAWGVNSNDVETKKTEAVHINLDYIEVNVKLAGTLASQLLAREDVDDLADIALLRITGTLNDNDVSYIRTGMTGLIGLDLSGVNMTDMPSEMLRDKTTLVGLKLPKNLKTIGSYAMYGCTNLMEIELPEGLEYIYDRAFYGCTKLANVKWNDALIAVYSYAFYNTAITEFYAPKSLNHIAYAAFQNCQKLEKVHLENSNVTTLGGYAFGSCQKLSEVVLSDVLESMDYEVFYNSRITSIELPASLMYMGCEPFWACWDLKTVICKAISVPSADCNLFGSSDYSRQATLYVPGIALQSYKIASNWSQFGQILPIEGYEPDNIIVRNDMTIGMSTKVTNKPSISVEVSHNSSNGSDFCGHLWVERDTLDMSTFRIMMDDNYCHWDEMYGWNNNTAERSYATLINNGARMTAESVVVNNYMPSNYWTFMCLPFNVAKSEIGIWPADTDWVIRRYNSQKRADGAMSETWENVNDTIYAGEGFIMHSSNDQGWGSYAFPSASNDLYKNRIFASDNVAVALKEYTSENVYVHNRNWNFVGNPYPSFYDLRFTDFTAPVTVWKGNHYEAYSPEDDEYILHPFEAFFVQRPEDQAEIVFDKDGRQQDRTVRQIDYAPRRARTSSASREVFNLTLGNGEQSDRTRFVLNSEASCSYEMERDAAKFFATGAGAIDLYTVENGVEMAINERPAANGVVRLAMRVAQAGQYTIAMSTRSDREMVLVDHLTGTEIQFTDGASYAFDAKAGTTADRFEIRFASEATGIDTIAEQSDAEYYTTDGIRLNTKPATHGVYMIKQNGKVTKVVNK